MAVAAPGARPIPSTRRRPERTVLYRLVDHVFPPLPVRQWVLAVPKRLRWYLGREPRALSAVFPICLRVIERHLQSGESDAAGTAVCDPGWAGLRRIATRQLATGLAGRPIPPPRPPDSPNIRVARPLTGTFCADNIRAISGLA